MSRPISREVAWMRSTSTSAIISRTDPRHSFGTSPIGNAGVRYLLCRKCGRSVEALMRAKQDECTGQQR